MQDRSVADDKNGPPAPAAAPPGTDDGAAGVSSSPEQSRQPADLADEGSTGRERRAIPGAQTLKLQRARKAGQRGSGRALGILVGMLLVLSVIAML